MFNNDNQDKNERDFLYNSNLEREDTTPKSVWPTDGYGDIPFKDDKTSKEDDYKPAYVDNSFSNNIGNAFANLRNIGSDSNTKDDFKKADTSDYKGENVQSFSNPYIQSQPVNNQTENIQPARSIPVIESRPVQSQPINDRASYGDYGYNNQSAFGQGNPNGGYSSAPLGYYASGNGYGNFDTQQNSPVKEISEQETLPEISQEELRKQQKQAILAQKEEERRQALMQKQQSRQDAINQKEQAKQAKEQAKLDKLAEKDRLKQEKIDKKQQAELEKEQARQQAIAQKEQSKQQAIAKKEEEKQAKEQARLDAIASKEQAKLDKENAKQQSKQAKEQAKFEKQNKLEEQKQAKQQAKLDKKQAKEQAKLDKKLDKKNKKLKNTEEEQPLADTSFVDMNEYTEDTSRRIPEEKDMLGGDFIVSPQPTPSPAPSAQVAPPQQTGYVPKFVSKDVDTVLVTLPDKAHMTRKQKKIAKKASRFDEMDLRNYPMTVGKWIGTFIVMMLPLINVIAGIFWFFGVGNKSRTAFVRSIFVLWLIITILVVGALGAGYFVLAQKAEAETGQTGFFEVLTYGANLLCDALAGVVGEDKIEPIRQQIVGFLESLSGGSSTSASNISSSVFLE